MKVVAKAHSLLTVHQAVLYAAFVWFSRRDPSALSHGEDTANVPTSQVWKMKGNCLLGLCNWKWELGLQTRQPHFCCCRPLVPGQSLHFLLLSGTVIRFSSQQCLVTVPPKWVPSQRCCSQRSLQMAGK